MAPANSLLRSKLLDVFNREGNKTLYSEELERLKHTDPDCLPVMHAKLDELYSNRKYQECEALLKDRIRLYGEDQSTAGVQALLLIADEKYDELVKLAEQLYTKYPDDAELAEWMFSIQKDVYQNKKAAFKVFERFVNNSYHYGTYKAYGDALTEAGDQKKGLAIKDRIVKRFPYSPSMAYELARYYFGTKQFDRSEEYLSQSISVSPYTESYWELKGDIQREKKNNSAALQAYNRSLELNPNQYSLISKVRKLKNKPEVSTLFEETDVLKVIDEDKISNAKNADYGFYYILDKVDAIVYPEGAKEQFVTVLIRITNDKGIENYKGTSIGYGYGQSLLIENSQIIKPNKSRINGERNGNEIVFPNLEVGDVVYLRYRLQSFSTGRLGRKFWAKHHFTGHIYSSIVSYNLLVPADQKLQYVLTKSELKPEVRDIEDFKMYSWLMRNGEVLKNEPMMPLMVDAASVLHLSTISDWNEITNWYSDGLSNKSEENIETMSLYQSLFPDKAAFKNEHEKARAIYDYIAANIKYSSVPFRQAPLIPQRASATVTSKLGDCKDLSNLFVTLAHMAGINAQLVLIDTRDNGMNDIMLPSIDFNHCIAKAVLDGKPYYIELTDNHLPFASLPNSLNGALALEIPSKSLTEKSSIITLLLITGQETLSGDAWS